MYKPVDPKVSFPKMEEGIARYWADRKIFERSISQREGGPAFSFYDGPPFATGLPHFGHIVPGTIKDIVPRYKTMKGFQVERRFGWDCHGLPVENLIEKELGLNSKTDIERYGIAKFNEACRASVLRYVKEWRTIMTRAGRWVDFDDDYKTMDPDYMESIWWVVKSLWDKGLVYEGKYILPYCPRCATVLSNHELAQDGVYKNVHDPALTVRFAMAGQPGAYFLAWTTTPWTLPSNLALTVGPDIDYVMVEDGAERYVLAEPRLAAYYKEPASLKVLWRKKGAELAGMAYEPLFPYFAGLASQGAFRLHTGDFVTTQDGTGIVHTAPGFGEDDYRVLKDSGLPAVCPIDAECRFTGEVPDYQGLFVKDADKAIIERLKAEGKIVKRDQYLHSYPHCWRCDSPLIYRGVSSWFVRVEPIKRKMLDANAKVFWVPAHIKEGRFGKWLEGARDWAISRSRYWGNPIPIWKCPDCGKTECYGSRDELAARSGQRPADLHKHFVDGITVPCACGGTMRRIPEVLDCWFESGSMPYAQVHYPFENRERFLARFPSDFIAEGQDQTRGWFYSLTVLAAALFDRPAFKACVVNGMVLAQDGKKMSKSLRNYTDPADVLEKFGADALRLFLMNSSLARADDLTYGDEGVRDVLKSVLIPLWNAYGFFVTYANIDGVDPAKALAGADNPLDRWILSVCEAMVADVSAGLEAYDMQKAIAPIVEFIDLLNNWYIRRSRRRFWRSGGDADKACAYAALYRALTRLCLCMAPFAPFISEEIWRNLRRGSWAESVHLADWPEYEAAYRDEDLERKMSVVRKAVSMGRALRTRHDLKIRQPLKAVHIVTRDRAERGVLLEMEDIVREELNVKEVLFRDNEEELVEYRAKANFRVLGKELGPLMKAAAARVERLAGNEIASLLEGATLQIEVEGRAVDLDASKVEIQRIEKDGLRVQNEGSLTLGLDSEITEALLDEGNARDLVRGIANLRKESGFEITDRIRIRVSGGSNLERAHERFGDMIRSETLAVSSTWSVIEGVAGMVEVEAADGSWKIAIEKA